MKTTAALILDTFREAFARRIFWGFFGCCTALMLFLMFIMRVDVVQGAIATVTIFGRNGPTRGVETLVHQTQGVIAMILAAIYILWMYQRTMNGPTADSVATMPDLRPRELLAVVPLIALIIAMGVYPKPVLDVINPAVKATMSQVGSADPVPAHPAAAQNGAQP